MTLSVMSFDTHHFYTQLKQVGFSDEQANAIALIQRETAAKTLEQVKHDYQLDDIATKRDLKEIELKIEMVKKDIELIKTELKKDIEIIRAELKKDIAESNAALSRTILNVGVGVGLTQIFAAFVLFMRMTGKI